MLACQCILPVHEPCHHGDRVEQATLAPSTSCENIEMYDEADYEICRNNFLVQPFVTLPTLTPLCLSKTNPVRCGQLKELLPHDLYFSFRCQVLAIRVLSGRYRFWYFHPGAQKGGVSFNKLKIGDTFLGDVDVVVMAGTRRDSTVSRVWHESTKRAQHMRSNQAVANKLWSEICRSGKDSAE